MKKEEMGQNASGGGKAASDTSDLERKISENLSDRAKALADRLAGLVCLIQKGDEEAFEEFYEASKIYVINNIRSISSADADLTEEIAQEVYIKIFTNIRSINEPQGVLKWVKVITANTVRDYYKKAGVKHETLIKDEAERDFIFENSLGNSLAGNMPLPEDIVENAATRKIVADAIKELPPDQFAVLAEFYYNEIPIKEIAENYGISEGAVKTRLSRTRKALKEKFEKMEKEQGIRLRSAGAVSAFVYLLWLYMSETPVSDTVSASVKAGVFGSAAVCGVIGAGTAGTLAAAEGVSGSAAGGAGSIAEGSGAAIGSSSSAAQSAAGAAAGAAVKAAGLSVGIKAAIIAAAAVVAIGGGTAAYIGISSSNNNTETVSENTEETLADTDDTDFADEETDGGDENVTETDDEAAAQEADDEDSTGSGLTSGSSTSSDNETSYSSAEAEQDSEGTEDAAVSGTSAEEISVSGPEAALSEFVDAVNAHDSEAILECFDSGTRSLSEEMAGIYGLDMADILSYYFGQDVDFTEEISVSGVNCAQEDDAAVLTFDITYKSGSLVLTTETEMDMVLEDGQWKINLE